MASERLKGLMLCLPKSSFSYNSLLMHGIVSIYIHVHKCTDLRSASFLNTHTPTITVACAADDFDRGSGFQHSLGRQT